MKKSKKNFESMSNFTQISKDQLGSITGGKAAALMTSLTCITSTGPCGCTDAGDHD